jgi:hypothetical protein
VPRSDLAQEKPLARLTNSKKRPGVRRGFIKITILLGRRKNLPKSSRFEGQSAEDLKH